MTANANIAQNLGSTSTYWNNTYTSSVYAPSIYGTLQTAAQTNITSVGNLISVSASGTIQTTGVVWGNSGIGGTLLTAAQTNITSLGNLTSLATSGNISTTQYFIGNGSQLTGLPATYGNTQVASYLPTYSGNITASYFLGNGSQLTGVSANAKSYVDTQVSSVSSGLLSPFLLMGA